MYRSSKLMKSWASLNLDAPFDELRDEEGADELEAAVASRLLHVEEDEDDGVIVLVDGALTYNVHIRKEGRLREFKG